jgi:uncharacterized protein YbjT (DUF2867 family)
MLNYSTFTSRIVERDHRVRILSRRGSGTVRRSVEMPWKVVEEVDGNNGKLYDELNDKAS